MTVIQNFDHVTDIAYHVTQRYGALALCHIAGQARQAARQGNMARQDLLFQVIAHMRKTQ